MKRIAISRSAIKFEPKPQGTDNIPVIIETTTPEGTNSIEDTAISIRMVGGSLMKMKAKKHSKQQKVEAAFDIFLDCFGRKENGGCMIFKENIVPFLTTDDMLS